MVRKACGAASGLLAALLFVPALMFRPDTPGELSLARVADIAVGFLLAVAFLLTRTPTPVGRPQPGASRTVLRAALLGAAVSGPLLLVHAGADRGRSAAPRSLTIYRLQSAHMALANYTTDCGSPPPEAQGLDALWKNPGVPNWSGPYLRAEELTDGWGNALRYSTRNGRVWSCGPDGQSGTDDDIAGAP